MEENQGIRSREHVHQVVVPPHLAVPFELLRLFGEEEKGKNRPEMLKALRAAIRITEAKAMESVRFDQADTDA